MKSAHKRMQAINNILLATDLSEFVDELVRAAEAYANAFSSKVFVIHITPPQPGLVGYPKLELDGPSGKTDEVHIGWDYDRKVLADHLRAKHIKVQEIADRLSKSGVTAKALLIEGAFVEKLLSEVARLEIDLVIIGSHEPAMIKDLLIGNVAKEIVGRIPCPILIVPPGANMPG